MYILSIETSCDETAVSIVRADGSFPHATYHILGNALSSQIEIHREYGGVFPAIAKREHAKALTPLLEEALTEAHLYKKSLQPTQNAEQVSYLTGLLARESGLSESLISFISTTERPPIDLIAVTSGPGLEPALWVGINFARALGYLWNIPVVPVNHMEGHVLSSLFTGEVLPDIAFPALSLLISGGHTELIEIRDWLSYKKIGETRDDAVGEAFDKVARMLGLPYPGGPEISRRAKEARERQLPRFTPLPRPMLDAPNLDFSFSGIKTAVRYAVEKETLTHDVVCRVACEFEEAVTEVLLGKTKRALDMTNARTLIIGGGVSANTYIREIFATYLHREYPTLTLYFPEQRLSTDNSIMIALAGHAHSNTALTPEHADTISANGHLSF